MAMNQSEQPNAQTYGWASPLQAPSFTDNVTANIAIWAQQNPKLVAVIAIGAIWMLLRPKGRR